MTDGKKGQELSLEIGELAGRAGLKTSALRYYERMGLLDPVGRAGGRRVFDENGPRQLAVIEFWQDAGFTLRELSTLLHELDGDMSPVKEMARSRVAELDRHIEQAQKVRGILRHVLGCLHERLTDCPDYREHIGELTSEIVTGEFRRDHHPRFHPLARPDREE